MICSSPMSRRNWAPLDSPNSLLNQCSPVITSTICSSPMSRIDWALGLESFWIFLTIWSNYVPLALLLSYVPLQCQEQIRHLDWNPKSGLSDIIVLISPVISSHQIAKSEVEKRKSTRYRLKWIWPPKSHSGNFWTHQSALNIHNIFMRRIRLLVFILRHLDAVASTFQISSRFSSAH